MSQTDTVRTTIESTLDHALESIGTNIVQLNQILSIFGPKVSKDEIARVSEQYGRLKEFFVSQILNLPVAARRDSFSVSRLAFEIQFGDLAWFWRSLPKLHKLKDGVQWPDPADGVIIPAETIERARSVLCRFRDAWYAANVNDPPTDEERLNVLEYMPRIAMVLWVTRKHHLFNKFVEKQIKDEDMDRNAYQPGILLEEDARYIQNQYSRARERRWHDGEHLRLGFSEPLPLEHLTDYKSGPFSAVDKVKDLWNNKEYARKVVKTDPESEAHIKTEIMSLKELSKEDHGHHLIKYVKTYERGEEIGILLSPVARENLDDLLRRCCNSARERQMNRPALFRAFGCLTYSLCYLHNVRFLRHRDVKPHNILCLTGGLQEEFIWSDFGLAYDFSQEVGSGTASQGFRATPQYEAPEIGQPGSLHGRSADVFSFGCVFLEIISVLTMDKNAETVPVRQYWHHYRDHIPELERWIQNTTNGLKGSGGRTIKKILELCSGMIKQDPIQRLKIGEIARKLAALKENGSLNPHPFCNRCVEKRKIDESRTPRHERIFEHKKIGQQSQRSFQAG